MGQPSAALLWECAFESTKSSAFLVSRLQGWLRDSTISFLTHPVCFWGPYKERTNDPTPAYHRLDCHSLKARRVLYHSATHRRWLQTLVIDVNDAGVSFLHFMREWAQQLQGSWNFHGPVQVSKFGRNVLKKGATATTSLRH